MISWTALFELWLQCHNDEIDLLAAIMFMRSTQLANATGTTASWPLNVATPTRAIGR